MIEVADIFLIIMSTGLGICIQQVINHNNTWLSIFFLSLSVLIILTVKESEK